MPERLTESTIRVLEAMLGDLTMDWYGLQLIDETGLRSGTLYPILHRLETDGWLASSFESVDPSEAGRPRRRLYRLTGDGVPAAREAITIWREKKDRGAKRRGSLRPGVAT